MQHIFGLVNKQFSYIFSLLQTISVSQHWARAHRYASDNAPCTGVVCSSPEIVTVGEDGKIIIFRADQEGVIRVIGMTETYHITINMEVKF